ncbi:MAG TPA: CHRD domain-containing protein [Planctomycetota bacterium]|nr:CHRD domain-containing protein [Planctomycetota bacterium]
MRYLLATYLFATLSVAQQVTYLSAFLEGAQETPPVVTAARGFGIARVNEPANTVTMFVFAEGLSGPATAAHIHVGAVGVAGPVLIPLTIAGSVMTGSGTLTAAQVTTIKTGGMYFNVHTAANPGGEIRGQVLLPVSTRFTGTMDGAQEVPPVITGATGSFFAFLHEPDNRLVYEVNTTGLTAILGHLHLGAVGVAGPVIFQLTGNSSNFAGISPRLPDALVTILKAGGCYFNVHTVANPNGEIRGQINASVDDFAGTMSGAQETPPTPSTATGTACVRVNQNGSVSATVNFSGLGSAFTAGHIHDGAPGVAGPIILPLNLTGPTTLTGSFTPTAVQLADLRAGLWYANVHTVAFGNGEIRGQLTAAVLPPTFGGACLGSNGERPEIGVDGIPCLGTSFSFKLYGALANALSVLSIGFDRDNSGVGPLPVQMTALGFNAPGCFFEVNPLSNFVGFADGLGRATFTLTLPYIPGLVGLPVSGQCFVFDAAANGFGLVASNGAYCVVR